MSEQITSAMLDELERLEQALEAESGTGFEPIDPWPVTPAENALILALLDHGSELIAAARRAERYEAALREAVVDADHSPFCSLTVHDCPCGGWTEGQITEQCDCWIKRARTALTPQPPTTAS